MNRYKINDKMTGIAGHFIVYLKLAKDYFTSFAGVSAFLSVQVAFLSEVQQAFLSAVQLAFLSFEQHSFFSVAFLLSSFVEALTLDAAKPIVKANAKTIANFFMISNFYWLLINSLAKLNRFL
jgi:hypothetical protein